MKLGNNSLGHIPKTDQSCPAVGMFTNPLSFRRGILLIRKADLVLVLGSSLSVPTACDLPEECLEPREGKPETCQTAGRRQTLWFVYITITVHHIANLLGGVYPTEYL